MFSAKTSEEKFLRFKLFSFKGLDKLHQLYKFNRETKTGYNCAEKIIIDKDFVLELKPSHKVRNYRQIFRMDSAQSASKPLIYPIPNIGNYGFI